MCYNTIEGQKIDSIVYGSNYQNELFTAENLKIFLDNYAFLCEKQGLLKYLENIEIKKGSSVSSIFLEILGKDLVSDYHSFSILDNHIYFDFVYNESNSFSCFDLSCLLKYENESFYPYILYMAKKMVDRFDFWSLGMDFDYITNMLGDSPTGIEFFFANYIQDYFDHELENHEIKKIKKVLSFTNDKMFYDSEKLFEILNGYDEPDEKLNELCFSILPFFKKLYDNPVKYCSFEELLRMIPLKDDFLKRFVPAFIEVFSNNYNITFYDLSVEYNLMSDLRELELDDLAEQIYDVQEVSVCTYYTCHWDTNGPNGGFDDFLIYHFNQWFVEASENQIGNRFDLLNSNLKNEYAKSQKEITAVRKLLLSKHGI